MPSPVISGLINKAYTAGARQTTQLGHPQSLSPMRKAKKLVDFEWRAMAGSSIDSVTA